MEEKEDSSDSGGSDIFCFKERYQGFGRTCKTYLGLKTIVETSENGSSVFALIVSRDKMKGDEKGFIFLSLLFVFPLARRATPPVSKCRKLPRFTEVEWMKCSIFNTEICATTNTSGLQKRLPVDSVTPYLTYFSFSSVTGQLGCDCLGVLFSSKQTNHPPPKRLPKTRRKHLGAIRLGASLLENSANSR